MKMNGKNTITNGTKQYPQWIRITDDDFDVDFSKPVIIFTDEGSLFAVSDIDDMNDYTDDESFYDRNNKCLTEEGKDLFRSWFIRYIYADDDFMEMAKREATDDYHAAMSDEKLPERFVQFENGEWNVLDYFDFDSSKTTVKRPQNDRKTTANE